VTFFLLFVTASFYITKSVTLRRSEMWLFLTILYLAKSGHNKDGYRMLQKSFSCDCLWPCLLLYFTLNRLSYIGCCRTNNYQKHICFWWSNITSLILEVTLCCLCPGGPLRQSGAPDDLFFYQHFFGGSLKKKILPWFGEAPLLMPNKLF
jgi:hypothetical protein